VEALKYERDMRLANDANKMSGGGGGGGGPAKAKKNDGAAALANAKASKGGPFAFLSGMSKAYKARLLNPEDRTRGQNRSDYIKSLLVNPDD
jgi:hypothetical protein